MAEEDTERNADALDLSALGSFDFTPAWAKGKPDDKAKFAQFEPREERRDDRAARPSFSHPRPDRRDDRGPRPSFGKPRSDRRDDRGPRLSSGRPFPGRRDDRPPREFVKPLDVEVRILPGQKQLGEFIRRIQGAPYMAYPLKQLAYFFLDHLEACVLRIAPKKDAAEPIVFHQCKACGFVAFSEEELMSHVLAAHLGDYYTCEEVECEAPKGAFTCVAKCGLSGELLGPPNLHGYDARVREMVRTRFPNMSEAAYRARIEMVRDADAVEAWRQTATKKTIFRRKGEQPAAAAEGAEGEVAPAIEREAAELEFRRTIAPSLMTSPKTVDMPADMALKSSNRGFVFACRDALAKEKRFPASLFYALRGAFHHRKLQFFRANDPRGPEFVTSVKPSPLDVAHAIPELAELVKYVEANPDLAPGAVVAALSAGDAAKAQNAKAHIMWLLEKGHLVCYANGGLVPPADHPRWRPAPRKPVAEKKSPEPPVAVEPPPATAPSVAPAPEQPPAEPPVTPVDESPATEPPTVPAPAAE
ncbi:MAG: hypothetical protein ACI4RA_06270 [Kiritimatiellia bacterium]